jgi:hypothetical protein
MYSQAIWQLRWPRELAGHTKLTVIGLGRISVLPVLDWPGLRFCRLSVLPVFGSAWLSVLLVFGPARFRFCRFSGRPGFGSAGFRIGLAFGSAGFGSARFSVLPAIGSAGFRFDRLCLVLVPQRLEGGKRAFDGLLRHAIAGTHPSGDAEAVRGDQQQLV